MKKETLSAHGVSFTFAIALVQALSVAIAMYFTEIGIIIFGLIVTVAWMVIQYFKTKSVESFIKFVFKREWHSWLVSMAAGFTALSTFLLANWLLMQKVNASEWTRQLPSALGLYLSIFIAVMGIKLLYSHMAPITDFESLLNHVTEDIANCEHRDEHLIISFPALNIGEWRTINDNGERDKSKSTIYDKYESAIKDRAKYGRSKIFVLDNHYVKILYKRYEEAISEKNKKTESQERVNQSTSNAIDLADAFSKNPQKNTVKKMKPEEIPPNLIVAGDIVYIITTFGMPFFDASSNEYKGGSGGTAELLAYRHDDSGFASIVRSYMEQYQ